jgi:hypothetical protein
MQYTGAQNTRCPICKQTVRFGHPVLYRVNNLAPRGEMWCSICFDGLYTSYHGALSENHIQSFQNGTLRDTLELIWGNEMHPIVGFWFCQFDNVTPLGLVVSFSNE